MKLRNALLSATFALLLCGPLALLVAQRGLGLDLPSWLTSEEAVYLEGSIFDDGETAGIASELSLDGFASERLQGAVEEKVDAHIPCKAAAMVANAALQRTAIEASNALFGWECYPTFFGSDKVYIPAQGALAYVTAKQDPALEAGLGAFCDAVSEAARANPDVKFVVYFAGGYETPALSPTSELVSDPMTYADMAGVMEEGLGDAPGVSLLTSSYDSLDEYYADFFRTDNHYNIDGGIKIYNQIAEAAGLVPYADDGTRVAIEDYAFYGALSRWSLDLVGEEVFDTGEDYSHLRLPQEDGTEAPVTHDDFWECDPDIYRYAFYALYYNNVAGLVTGGSGDKDVYLVSNSYGGGVLRMMAEGSASVERTEDLHPGAAGSTGLADRLAQGDCDVVVFLGTPADYASFMSRNPGFFTG